MTTHHDHFVEQNGNILPAYTGENAPRFERLDEIGHVATLDVMVDTADYEDAAEAAAKAAEQAERERLGLTDEALYRDWELMKAEKAAVAQAERERKAVLAAVAPSGPQQRRNARKAEREHERTVVKQIRRSNQGSRSARSKTDNSQQLQLIG